MRMPPEEFILWLKGAVDMTPGSGPPNREQWELLKERLAEAVGGIIKERLVGREMLAQPFPPSYFLPQQPQYAPNPLAKPYTVTCTSSNTTGPLTN